MIEVYKYYTKYNINFLYLRFNSFFNWTMTYRLDSDIPEPYGYLESRYFYFSGETVPLKDSLTGRTLTAGF